MNGHEIRADYDRDTIVVYQAYQPGIGKPAVANGRFVEPFSRGRMTWIKPSFLWMMARSDWGRKPGQEMVLAVRITRSGWEEALGSAELTHADKRVYRSTDEWRERFARALVRVQWDPEKTLRGATLDARSIQVGISRHVVGRYFDDWTVAIDDLTPTVRKIHRLLQDGQDHRAKDLLPRERTYPIGAELAHRLGIDT
ncbi:DUF4291 domain-containing protein [Nocardia sp. GCM10030253]|uniref:DUF4291 domain-containing protein n=1 Tax=Nocardia sp. GCM10030253 TaxID=3273404 RepID=UPI003633CA84